VEYAFKNNQQPWQWGMYKALIEKKKNPQASPWLVGH
jgi:hypothetical protein